MIGEMKARATIVFIILIIISLALAGVTFYFFQQEHTKGMALLQELTELKTKEKITEEKLEETKVRVSSLELKLKDAQVQADTLADTLQKEKASRQENLAQIEKLKMDLQQQLTARADFEVRFNQAREEVNKKQSELSDLQSQKTELENKIKELEAKAASPQPGVELGKIVVNPDTNQPQPAEAKVEGNTPKPAAALEGKVLVVNKEYNFAVISLGNKDAVKTGDMFSIYRGNKYIGDVKVEKVQDSMSAAGFVSKELKDKVNEGDRVVQKI